jgi:hypothetical protein
VLRWLLVLFASGCVVPFVVPSARVDSGFTQDHMLSTRIGTHFAGYRLDENAGWDIGGGYAITQTADATAAVPATTKHGATMATGPTFANGGYIEAAWMRRVESFARIGLGPGLALQRRDDGTFEHILYLRGSIELFSRAFGSGSGGGKCGVATGVWFGQMGVGTYVDVEKPIDDAGIAVVAGLTVRLPAFAGVALVVPGCK